MEHFAPGFAQADGEANLAGETGWGDDGQAVVRGDGRGGGGHRAFGLVVGAEIAAAGVVGDLVEQQLESVEIGLGHVEGDECRLAADEGGLRAAQIGAGSHGAGPVVAEAPAEEEERFRAGQRLEEVREDLDRPLDGADAVRGPVREAYAHRGRLRVAQVDGAERVDRIESREQALVVRSEIDVEMEAAVKREHRGVVVRAELGDESPRLVDHPLEAASTAREVMALEEEDDQAADRRREGDEGRVGRAVLQVGQLLSGAVGRFDHDRFAVERHHEIVRTEARQRLPPPVEHPHLEQQTPDLDAVGEGRLLGAAGRDRQDGQERERKEPAAVAGVAGGGPEHGPECSRDRPGSCYRVASFWGERTMSDNRKNLGLFLLRLAGLHLALGHGLGKVIAFTSGNTGFIDFVGKLGFPMPALFGWAAALSELVGGLLVLVGLFTVWGALFGAATMFTAAFINHHALSQWLGKLGIGSATAETIKGWGSPELAIIYLLILLAVALLGPGGWSLDAKLRGKRR